ncbi:thiamine pyrophosphokinase [Pseudooceanicola antarcticus]|uniref:Thiamine diphosphokinase n=1 Tax=Pseudooceanicola antarcticus TaxID=1247613 RepID=A0A285ITL9_9RHOB|nr:thiamine diphosphokinase [Pseudooceanicola antarcticus]PJE32035.1 thiamine diphosphokinase [Pseudooceanicola antarcticus]SNY51338.1 thiamine pyrophosphokinase [Pseudooceanicola antarcticus]
MGLETVVESAGPVALIGGGAVPGSVAERILRLCGPVVAADGGAEYLLRAGRMPDAVIGDMDSLSGTWARLVPEAALHPVAEQESTDFEKCLTRIEAPLVIGTGFLGPRSDHMLAALSVLARFPARRCLLASESDLAFLCPPELVLDRPVGERFSLFPMGLTSGRSEGLEWPIDGLDFAPDGRIGTSNRISGPLRLRMDQPGMVVILPVAALEDVATSICAGSAPWSARAG